MEKRYTLKEIRIMPSREGVDADGDAITIPATVSYAYQTEIVESGAVIARSAVHRGTAPMNEPEREVVIALDGETRTVGAVLNEAGYPT